MEQAEMVGLIRTVLIIVLIFYGVRILTRIVFPWLLKRFVRKVERKINDQMNNPQGGRAHSSESFTQEGDVLIRKSRKQASKNPKDFDGGEYVDFEEVN